MTKPSFQLFLLLIAGTLFAETGGVCGYAHDHGAWQGLRESVIDARYHTYEEIVDELDSLSRLPQYIGILKVEEIGRSTNEDLPIFAVKLSDNPEVDEDEAELLFLGQCHAEEILGVEIAMGLIDTLLHGYDAGNTHIYALLQNLETWIVPTHNPEGLRVVHDGWDVTYRKNKTDCNGNGEFDFVEGIGWDIDGVDFNRQFDFNWIYGDGYLVGDYDYFRGFAPFTETEVVAIADLARAHNFVFSIQYHSARSGTPEIIYYSWEWEDIKHPPDWPVINHVAGQFSSRIINESGEGNYALHPGTSRRGNAHDWFYTETGCIQMLAEVGTNNLQPAGPIVDDTVERNLEGCFYLMDRALGFPPESRSQIRGIVRDAGDAMPLEGARVAVSRNLLGEGMVSMEGPMVKPRTTDQHGRYLRILLPGSYTLVASAPGFEPDTVIGVSASDGYPTDLDFMLEPMPSREILLELPDLPGVDSYEVVLEDHSQRKEMNLTAGTHSLQLNTRLLDITVVGPGYFPELHRVQCDSFPQGEPIPVQVNPPERVVSYTEHFDDLAGWQIEAGDWQVNNGMVKSHSGLNYDEGMSIAMISPVFSMGYYKRIGVEIAHSYELEWIHDSIRIEVLDHTDNQPIWQVNITDQDFEMHRDVFFSVQDLPGFGRLRLSMWADSTVEYRGWIIDSLCVFVTPEDTVAIDDERKYAARNHSYEEATFSLAPNPVLARTTLTLQVPEPQTYTLEIYDLLGRTIRSTELQLQAGERSWEWDRRTQAGELVPAGIYLVRVQGNALAKTQKLLLLSP